jgi:ABC-type bacteriocin/lantibiotic exporter with double-glycine peptidase domain
MSVVDYDDGTRLIENVPACHQGNTNTCAQACVTSILNYWGHHVRYEDIIAETSNQTMTAGMPIERMVWYFRRYGLQARSYGGNLSNLKALIDRGCPSVVSFDESTYNHVVVVVGYNDYTELIFYIDSMDGEIIEEPYSDFVRAWGRKRAVTGFVDMPIPNLMIEVKR